MYVALPELPLESTLSRKLYSFVRVGEPTGIASRDLSTIGVNDDGCDPARPRSRRIPIVADRARQYLLLADEDLISLVQEARDSQAFATLYDRHSRAAYSLAYRMMGERQAAEDILQEAFLKAWRGAAGYRTERASVRTWLLSIVHNRAIDQLRSLASRRRTQERVEASSAISQPSEAFAHSWRNTQREQVREALKSLPREQLKVLELAYFSGYTHLEIAELLGLPLGTVKGRVRLGLKKLRGLPLWEAA